MLAWSSNIESLLTLFNLEKSFLNSVEKLEGEYLSKGVSWSGFINSFTCKGFLGENIALYTQGCNWQIQDSILTNDPSLER